MEKYKAMKNNTDEKKEKTSIPKGENHSAIKNGNSSVPQGGNVPQEEEVPKTQDEINAENNANNIKNAADVAIASKNPYAMAAGYAIKGLDKMTGGKSTQAMGNAMNKANKMTPGGQQIQKASNKMSESGASDKVGAAARAKNSGGSNGSAASAAAKSGGGGKGSGMGSMKMKLIVAVAAFSFIIFMSMIAAIASKDSANLDITNASQMARKNASAADVVKALEEVGNWYINNVSVYDQSLYVQSPFSEAKVRADCTGFAVAYMSYVAGSDVPNSYSLEMIYPDGDWAKKVEELGWIAYTSDEIGELQSGDVLIADNRALYSTKGQHAEIYIDDSHTFGWGSPKTSYPTNNIITKSEFDGHVHFMDSSHDYITIYRYAGAVSLSDMNVVKMFDSSFNHGIKAKENQKYIMLHDTEMSENAETVVNLWKSSANGVAAHFVIDRNGTIIQAVDLDVIAHHAGYGGPGDYDSRFGVGNNDGKGNGDDLVGTQPLSGYTSYGMNSYSIGIEMCHVNGEDYPEELLKSLDKVITYIDSYYGTKSEIIDHKAWRPSNSDTDTKFASYLENYKNLRHY